MQWNSYFLYRGLLPFIKRQHNIPASSRSHLSLSILQDINSDWEAPKQVQSMTEKQLPVQRQQWWVWGPGVCSVQQILNEQPLITAHIHASAGIQLSAFLFAESTTDFTRLEGKTEQEIVIYLQFSSFCLLFKKNVLQEKPAQCINFSRLVMDFFNLSKPERK